MAKTKKKAAPKTFLLKLRFTREELEEFAKLANQQRKPVEDWAADVLRWEAELAEADENDEWGL